MSESTRTFIVSQELDEIGEPEEFSWDLWPLVDPNKTLHLNENGLPKIGTKLTPGMILVGKIGKTKSYQTDRKPTTLEINALTFEEIHRQFGHLWADRSTYVPEGIFGVVLQSELSVIADGKVSANIKIRLGNNE